MLFRPLSIQYGPQEERQTEARPAAKAFLETQKHVAPPFAIVLQSAHAQLAGDLATSLCLEAFGKLPADAVEAIRQHDAGWERNDTHQMQVLSTQDPRPFPDIPAEESVVAWQDSIRHAEAISALAMVLVSRHFCLLATGDPAHQEFKTREEKRRETIEKSLGISPDELNRWTGALGFCDLLSLYLCSGSKVPVAFPLCHPADSEADFAAKIVLSWKGGQISFPSLVIKPNTQLSLDAVLYRGRWRETESLLLEWKL
jgi:Protein of unknown function (DUF3891)